MDRSRFVIPLKFLKSKIVVELLKMAEDEFRFSSEQPIALPFESCITNHIIMHLSSRHQGDDDYELQQLEQLHSLAQFTNDLPM
ncbi:Auxin-responsive protein SAUR67 [Linum grandiflorum]